MISYIKKDLSILSHPGVFVHICCSIDREIIDWRALGWDRIFRSLSSSSMNSNNSHESNIVVIMIVVIVIAVI